VYHFSPPYSLPPGFLDGVAYREGKSDTPHPTVSFIVFHSLGRGRSETSFDASLDLQSYRFPSNSILAACFASPSSFSLQSMCANS
jgi:hypothetical protein